MLRKSEHRDVSETLPKNSSAIWLVEWLRLLFLVWNGPEAPRAQLVRIGLIDFFIVTLAVAFPWSTTATTGLVLAILLMMLITHAPRAMIDELKRPACVLPIALVGLAVVGTAWASGVPWSDRLHALEKVLKLLWLLPFFLHFQRTSHATSVFVAFVASNLVLLAFSYLVFLWPEVGAAIGAKESGVPLKNYIDQSQAFAFIAVVFLGLAAEPLRTRQRGKAIALVAVSAAFFANLAFVNIARTALLYIPAMLGVLLVRNARGWLSLFLFAGICILTAWLLAMSPNLQSKVSRLLKETDAFQANAITVDGYPAGGAERLEFWRKSIDFVRSAPIFGHGTGSTKGLFSAEAAGKTGIMAKVVDNPHNQTLAVTIQWGAVGCILLYAIWGVHLWLFRDGLEVSSVSPFAWIGLVAVVQNIVSSLVNSHLFDFYQGWLYLLAVGIAGGQLQREKLDTEHRELQTPDAQ
ncbi:O-antigen ligase family protein [Bradyrhizobium sp. AUGA SZCCT0283]|uniref:O-antigen ligase family protein n=1 Tax=Bradyrhizobium sp. AUGA SZCCT0283 TaxID=2807671 RepID=UPI001BA4E3FE|nr:O-antigen ligase family protein [Bradyrhizobium sp. AUGA SZCCT0283]MBR1277488.1 O-antigen ligase family protein [Bradyrhizobium sp. AUGA SZCCT0283]